MILLASGDANILRRWNGLLPDHTGLVQVDTRTRLDRFLGNRVPDLAVIHVELPGLGGWSGLQSLKQQYPECKVLVLSDVPNEEEGLSVLRIGCEGYANTYITAAILEKAIDLILHGEVWVGRRLVQSILGRGRIANRNRSMMDELTRREREVALLVAEGVSNREISRQLDVTERTVKAHLTSIFRKTGIKDRVQLALKVSAQPQLSSTGST